VARVMIVDDHPIVRDGLKTYLSLQGDLDVVGEAGDGDAALTVARDSRPDLVLLDLRLPTRSGLALLPALLGLRPAPRVVILSSFLDATAIHEALRLGASGYLLKHVGPGTLVDRMRAALRGEVVLDPAAIELLVELPSVPLQGLTAREREVLDCIVEGMSNKQVARALGITEKTVKTHVSHLLAKLGVRDRTQAAVLAAAQRDAAP
jgi:DNA-binding NarL/FixJ family response regulator